MNWSKKNDGNPIRAESEDGEVILRNNAIKIVKNSIISKLIGAEDEIRLDELSKVEIEAKTSAGKTLISVKFKKETSGIASLFGNNAIRTIWRDESDYKAIVDILKEENIKVTESGTSSIKEREIKRTCNACGNVWHVQEQEIEELKQAKRNNKMAGALTAASGQLAASAQTNRNQDSATQQLKELERCPECRSKNYEEKNQRDIEISLEI